MRSKQPNFFNQLVRRESNGQRQLDAEPLLNIRYDANVYNDRRINQKIPLKHKIKASGRCKDFVAIYDETKCLSLWDISIPSKLWTLEKLKYHYDCDWLIVGEDGLVLYIKWDLGFPDDLYISIQIILNGKVEGAFEVDDGAVPISQIKIINNRILGFESFKGLNRVHEWDIKGHLIRSHLMDLSIDGYVIDANYDYYLVSPRSKKNLKQLPMFIVDLNINKSYIFHLPLEIDAIEAVNILGNKLVVTSKESVYKKTICVIDMDSQTLLQKYPLAKEGNTSRLISNDNFIAFLMAAINGLSTEYYIYYINQTTKKIKLIEIPEFSHFNMSMSNSILTVCYSNKFGFFSTKPREERIVIDMDSNKIVHNIEYCERSICAPSFSNHIWFNVSFKQEPAIYIENYRGFGLENEDIVNENSLRLS